MSNPVPDDLVHPSYLVSLRRQQTAMDGKLAMLTWTVTRMKQHHGEQSAQAKRAEARLDHHSAVLAVLEAKIDYVEQQLGSPGVP